MTLICADTCEILTTVEIVYTLITMEGFALHLSDLS